MSEQGKGFTDHIGNPRQQGGDILLVAVWNQQDKFIAPSLASVIELSRQVKIRCVLAISS